MNPNKSLLIIGLALVCFFMLALSSCGETKRAKIATSSTPATTSAATLITSSPSNSTEPDQLAVPDTIIFHEGDKNLPIGKGKQFDEIVSMTNARLKNAKILNEEQLADINSTSAISGFDTFDFTGIDTLEFDYTQVHSSAFAYNGAHSSPIFSSGIPKKFTVSIFYTKLIFPLTDNPDKSGSNVLSSHSLSSHSLSSHSLSSHSLSSHSLFSYGDPNVEMSVGGKEVAAVFCTSPIGSPDLLFNYLKGLRLS
jgi:hypothetical protein